MCNAPSDVWLIAANRYLAQRIDFDLNDPRFEKPEEGKGCVQLYRMGHHRSSFSGRFIITKLTDIGGANDAVIHQQEGRFELTAIITESLTKYISRI